MAQNKSMTKALTEWSSEMERSDWRIFGMLIRISSKLRVSLWEEVVMKSGGRDKAERWWKEMEGLVDDTEERYVEVSPAS